MVRKANEDAVARTAAEREVAELIAADGSGEAGYERAQGTAAAVLAGFECVEFETVTSKVRGGEEIPLRRIVITSGWTVDPNGK